MRLFPAPETPIAIRSSKSPYTTAARAKVNPSPTNEMLVSSSNHVLNVYPTVIPKYSLISQNPPLFTCEKISEPEPVASTSNFGLT